MSPLLKNLHSLLADGCIYKRIFVPLWKSGLGQGCGSPTPKAGPEFCDRRIFYTSPELPYLNHHRHLYLVLRYITLLFVTQ
ncbi:hypothetical protein HanPSC8_Chr13g0559411 [Helianthus annuus]|nr:hypothetical protein HanIR_Chr13g0632671 [Helianthus annuus]KAJ0848601.1 hypothetical protein HanPSC8_Chr13g0559411 [Helianthus annuus]